MQNNNFNDNFDSKNSKNDFEDIISDSSRINDSKRIQNFYANMNFDQSYYTGATKYRKKKHGLSKKISDRHYKIRKWWKCMKKGKKALIITVTSLLLILLILLGIFFVMFRYNHNDITDNPGELGFENVIDKDIINIALFGLDSRDTVGKTSFTGNSDSIMVLSINTVTKKVKIISLMRDTLVPIERDSGLTYSKINAAYSWGGPELAIKTINKCFELDISEYATVNFYGMSDIIDAVGGIDVTLTKDEVSSRGKNNHGINDMIGEICQYKDLNPEDYYVTVSGEQHLNGVQAVAYSRIRYCKNIWGTTNDFGRTDRQRYVMEQLFNKAKGMSKSQYVKLAKALIPCTETSLSYTQIMSIAFSVMFSSPTFEQYRIPQNSSEIDFLMPSPSGSFGSVVYFDLQYAAKVIKAIIYDNMTIEQYVEQYGIEKNDWYRDTKNIYGGGSSESRKPSNSQGSNYSSKSETTSSDVTSSNSSTDSSVTDSSSSSIDTSSDSGSSSDITSSSDSSDTQGSSSSDGGDTSSGETTSSEISPVSEPEKTQDGE